MSFRHVLLAAAVLIAGCSVPTDDNAQVIDQAELPETLQNTTTTTTTTVPVVTRSVDYFLLQPLADQDRRLVIAVPTEVPFDDQLTPLVAPMFSDDFAAPADAPELINRVTLFELQGVRIERDRVATVSLVVRDEPPGDNALSDVVAQLVWTLSQFETVDAVEIEIDGELRQSLPTLGAAADSPVDKDDYRLYDPEFDPPDPTTTTTTTTTTTVAPPTTTRPDG